MDWSNSEFAQVETLPEEYADKILSARSVKWVRIIYGIIFPLAIMGGVGLFIWAALCHREGVDDSNVSKKSQSLVLGSIAVVTFAALLIARFYIGTRNVWLKRVARNEINRRTNKIVNPDAAGVRFVEIVPKSNWSDTTLVENASDVGFLAVDLQRRCLLYEGDNERYRVPANAIVKSERDSYTRLKPSPYGKGPHDLVVSYYFLVITMQISAGSTVEIPFRIRRPRSPLTDHDACDENNKLLHEIHLLQNSVVKN